MDLRQKLSRARSEPGPASTSSVASSLPNTEQRAHNAVAANRVLSHMGLDAELDAHMGQRPPKRVKPSREPDSTRSQALQIQATNLTAQAEVQRLKDGIASRKVAQPSLHSAMLPPPHPSAIASKQRASPASMSLQPKQRKVRLLAQGLTHAIMCIDRSGSMRIKDVSSNNGSISRWQAVFDSADVFIAEQERRPDKDNVRFSLVLFDDESAVCFERLPLDGVRSALASARDEHSPRGGTCFAAGLKAVRALAEADSHGVLVIFLSDGRPADLPRVPDGGVTRHASLPSAYKAHGASHVSAAEHLQALREKHADRMALHFVGVSDEGAGWLSVLAACYKGAYHQTDLKLDEDAAPIIQDSSGAQAASSIRSTFRSISSTLSSMRSGAPQLGAPVLAKGVLEAAGEPFEEETYFATKMDWDSVDGHRILHIADTEAEGRQLRVHALPFARGGMRNVFRAVEEGREMPLVVKDSICMVPHAERLAFHKATTECQLRATAFARDFNRATETLKRDHTQLDRELDGVREVQFVTCEVYRLSKVKGSGEYRYISVEPFLEGEYIKYNTNNGFVRRRSGAESVSEAMSVETPQALSHYSFHNSGGEEMLVDLQGVEVEEEALGRTAARRVFRFTDPQVHSRCLKYGHGDRGQRGFDDFFRSHKCGRLCGLLGVPPQTGAD